MKNKLFVGLIAAVMLCIASTGMAATDPSMYEQIDATYKKGHPRMNTAEDLAYIKQSLDMTIAALEKDPDNYELMWRYLRGCAQYSEASSMQRWTVTNWAEICDEWAKKGLEMAPKAQAKEPARVEAYFWRTVCMGKYIEAKGGYNNLNGIMAAIKEGALPNTKKDVNAAYEADKTYLNYMPAYAQFQFLSHIPGFVAPKGQWELALKYFKEWDEGCGGYMNAYEPVTDACLGGEYLIRAVDKQKKSGMTDAEAVKYKAYAKEMLEFAAASDIRYYKEWAQSVLDDEKLWK